MERDNQIILAETLSVILQLTLFSYLPGNTIWVVSSFSFSSGFFFCLFFLRLLNIRLTQIPRFQRKRQRALVLACMRPCASAPSACQAENAVVLIHDRGGDGIHLGEMCRVVLGAVHVRRRCVNWMWNAQHIIYMWPSHYVMTPCQCGAELCHFKTLRAGFLWHQLVSVENPPATKYQESVLLSPLMKWRRCTESEWMFKK